MPSAPPITWSTWVPAPAPTAVWWSRRAPRREIEADPNSLTGAYLSGREVDPGARCSGAHRHRGQWLTIRGARGNNLQNLTVGDTDRAC